MIPPAPRSSFEDEAEGSGCERAQCGRRAHRNTTQVLNGTVGARVAIGQGALPQKATPMR
jgi:hypothetical protein